MSAGTSICRSGRSSTGPLTLAAYCASCVAVHLHPRRACPNHPHLHSYVAFLQSPPHSSPTSYSAKRLPDFPPLAGGSHASPPTRPGLHAKNRGHRVGSVTGGRHVLGVGAISAVGAAVLGHPCLPRRRHSGILGDPPGEAAHDLPAPSPDPGGLGGTSWPGRAPDLQVETGPVQASPLDRRPARPRTPRARGAPGRESPRTQFL